MDIEKLIAKIKEYNPESNEDLIRLAFDYAKKAHGTATRKSGEPYITHPFATAMILADQKMDDATIAAGLLHDVPEDTERTLDEVKKEFGKEIATLVEGITKLGQLKYRGVDRYLENLRKMFVAMASDIRTIFIKFADRLHNISTLEALPPEKRKRISQETIEIYAPIAARLGMSKVKGQLEDASFPFAYPEEYAWLMKKIKDSVETEKKYVNRAKKDITKILDEQEVRYISIDGRAKYMLSLYRKLIRYNKDLSKIHDIIALRIIVPTIAECYGTMGLIHQSYKPMKGRIKDYIAQPKPSGYQSLHTTIFYQEGKLIEVQVRTPEMHEQAEYGIAAHWNYSENDKSLKKKTLTKDKMAWLEQLVGFQKQIDDEQQYLESLKIEFFKNRIFVFTPEGDVIDLPEDATPIDFAYNIHSDLGNQCNGVKINEKIASLNTPLKSGDLVEIIKDKKRKGPSADWLNIVKTSSAKNKIKQRLAAHNKGFITKAKMAAEGQYEYMTKTKKIGKKNKS